MERSLEWRELDDLWQQLFRRPEDAIVAICRAGDQDRAHHEQTGAEGSDFLLQPIDPGALRASLIRAERLKQAQKRAPQAERLAAIGQMTAVLTHESRNAFQRLQANLEMLQEDRP